MSLQDIPAVIQAEPQWMPVLIEPSKTRPGKTEKRPISVHTCRVADATDPRNYGTFEQACIMQRLNRFGGIAFCLTANDPFCAVDLDGCTGLDGKLADWAQAIVDRIDSYTEASLSGTGVHILCRATLTQGGNRRGSVEVYDRARCIVTTGCVIQGRALIHDRQSQIEALQRDFRTIV